MQEGNFNILGNYYLIRKIGSGGTSTVYLGQHRESLEYFAVKVFTHDNDNLNLFCY